MPDSPNLLFTNAGMNQFVPIFLGQTKCPYTPGRAADTQKCIRAGGKHNDLDDVGLDTYHHTFFEMLGNWSFGDYFKKEAIDWAWELVVEKWKFPANRLYATVYCPHMRLDIWEKELKHAGDVISHGGQIIKATDYAHVFQNAIVAGEKPFAGIIEFEPSDMEAAQFWFALFKAAGLNPFVHIGPGTKKDNFWMMGETGPCGPCSELHVDLTPDGDTRGSLVNKGDARCIEIWNLVFIQFNANPDGTFSPLPAKHVDTGMGFERVTSIIQGTKNFSDFASSKISNYETDIFRPIFDALEKLSGKKYKSTLPSIGADPEVLHDLSIVGAALMARGLTDFKSWSADLIKDFGDKIIPLLETVWKTSDKMLDESVRRAVSDLDEFENNEPTSDFSDENYSEIIATDIAFRVIADHIRTLSFAIADGIEPGNTDRNYVLRRIHRRMVRYARTIDIAGDVLLKAQDELVETLARTMGDVFPEVRLRKEHIKAVLRREADSFGKTLDRGISLFRGARGSQRNLESGRT